MFCVNIPGAAWDEARKSSCGKGVLKVPGRLNVLLMATKCLSVPCFNPSNFISPSNGYLPKINGRVVLVSAVFQPFTRSLFRGPLLRTRNDTRTSVIFQFFTLFFSQTHSGRSASILHDSQCLFCKMKFRGLISVLNYNCVLEQGQVGAICAAHTLSFCAKRLVIEPKGQVVLLQFFQ